ADGGGGPGRRRNAERDHHRSKPNLVAVIQRRRPRHRAASEERAVLAAEIFDRRLRPVETNARVLARDPRGVYPNLSIRRAAEDVLPLAQRNLTCVPDEPEPHGRDHPGPGCGGIDGSDEPVSEAWHGPHVARAFRPIAKGATDF